MADKLSRSEKLQIIEKLAIEVAQALVGGAITRPNNSDGDLSHPDGTFSEVKSASQAGGAIIRRDQLRQHCRGSNCRYIIVFHENRIWKDGKYHYITLRRGGTYGRLKKNYLRSVCGIYVTDAQGMKILYRKMRRRAERTHQFKSGPKTYIKVRPHHFLRLVLSGYTCSSRPELIRVGSYSLKIYVDRIQKN